MAFFFGNKKKKKEEYKKGLHQTKDSFGKKILNIFSNKDNEEDFYDELEETLVMADVGVETTLEIIEHFKEYIKKNKAKDVNEFKDYFKQSLLDMIPEKPFELVEGKLNILFVLGVNGVGKTTSIGKIAYQMKNSGKKVMLAACDTFRAAAIDQLNVWSERADVPIIKQNMGADPGAVLHDAMDSAIAKKVDLLIVDTAGRLHNKSGLMAELEKLHRIIQKKSDDTNSEAFLVLDAGTGQNAFVQAESFNESVKLDGIILTKLDSTSKGGIVIALAHQLKIPVKFIGLGEKIEDLMVFDKEDYVDSLI